MHSDFHLNAYCARLIKKDSLIENTAPYSKLSRNCKELLTRTVLFTKPETIVPRVNEFTNTSY